MNKLLFPLFAGLMLFFTSCEDEKTAPPEPHIEFERFELYEEGDDYIFFRLIDGDGNFGIGVEENDPPFNAEPLPGDPVTPHGDNENHYNLKLVMFEMQDGDWVQTDPQPLLYSRITDIQPEEGEAYLEASIGYATTEIDAAMSNGLTIKFEIQVWDRALNRSNIIETPSLSP